MEDAAATDAAGRLAVPDGSRSGSRSVATPGLVIVAGFPRLGPSFHGDDHGFGPGRQARNSGPEHRPADTEPASTGQ